MADSTSNFYIKEDYNANFDITWSFQYAVTGSNNASGGFSTFLFNNTGLSGGGSYTGLGYTNYSTTSGVKGAVLGVLFYSDNLIKVVKGTSFSVLTTFNAPTLITPIKKTIVNYNTIRFNLTNIGQTLNIAIKNKSTNRYNTIASIDVNLNPLNSTFYKIGFGYSSPLTAGDAKIVLKLKDIQYQGINTIPTTTISPRPVSVPKSETFYVLQSPASSYIGIGIPDPINDGFILHKS
jgi:hypothetical protein